MSIATPRFYDFGPFRLDLTEHLLLRKGKSVAVSPKALSTLLVLVRNRGRIVEKEGLLKTVWPETFVEEATLAQNIFTLRRALGGNEGEQYIQTVPKRGYRFVGSVTEVMDQGADAPSDPTGPIAESVNHPKVDPEKAIRSLAVLPFISANTDPGSEFLSDAITESIVNSLSFLPQLHVAAYSTVHRYRGREVDPQAAGRELGVDAVLVGKLLQFGEKGFIRIELVDVPNGWQVWGEEYSDNFSDMDKLCETVARDVPESLIEKLSRNEHFRHFTRRPQNAEAYHFYMKGRSFLRTRTKRSYKRAIDCFEQAIEIDPGLALAHSGLADSYIMFGFCGLQSPWETRPKARRAAVRAVELDSEIAESHTSLAAIKLVYDHDLVGAEREFKRAIRLNPKYSHAHNGYAYCLSEMGQLDESLAECELAFELDPLDVEINQHLGWCYLLANKPDQAIEQLQKAVTLGPDSYRARMTLGIACEQKKEWSRAITHFLHANLIEKTPVLSGFLGYTYAMAGQKEALEILSDLLEESEHSYVPPYSIALIYTGLGRQDEALAWLQKAFIEYTHWRGWLKLIPEFHSLLSHPRFAELLRRGLNDAQY